jgi:ribosomal protein L30/L7E
MLLTANQVTEAIGRLPKHRVSLRKSLMLMLSLIEHGKEVKDTAPAWVQARNAIFVTTVDGGGNEEEGS